MIKNSSYLETKYLIIIGFLPTLIFNFGNLSSYLFQMVAGRAMDFENFGLFNEFNVYLTIILSPFLSMPLFISKFTTEFSKTNTENDFFIYIKDKISKYSKFYLLIAFTYLLIFDYHYDSKRLIAIIIIIINSFLSVHLTMYFAYLNGQKKYNKFSLSVAAPLILKFIFLLIIYLLFDKIDFYIALLTTTVGILIPVLIFKIKFQFKRNQNLNTKFNNKKFLNYIIPITLTTIFLTINLNLDIILIKSQVDNEILGKYSASSILGKAIFYFLSVIPLLLFPEINSGNSINMKNLLLKINISLLIVLSLIIIGMFFILFYSQELVSFTFGTKFKDYFSFLNYSYILFSILSLNNILIISLSALSNFKFLYANYFILFIFIIIFYFLKFSIINTLIIFIVCQIFLFIINYFFINFKIKSNHKILE